MSMKRVILTVAALAIAALAVSCTVSINGKRMNTIKGQGSCLTREYELSGFESIQISGCYDVRFIQTDGAYAVSVETYENIFERLDVRLDGKVLHLGQKGGSLFRTDKLAVTVQGPSLNQVIVNGSADLDIEHFKSADDLELTVYGAGDFQLRDISCDAFLVDVNGAGDLDVTELCCSRSAVTVNGAGDVDLEFIAAPEVNVSVNGAGDVRLSGVAGKVRYSISGAGNIDARKLSCEDFDGKKAGVGSIKQ